MAHPLPLPRASLLKIPTQQRSVHNVQAIIDAAIHILGTEGNLGFNTNRIAEAAGVSIGSLYQYFANKEMIASAIVERGVLLAESLLGSLVRKYAHEPPEVIMRRAVRIVTKVANPYRDAIRELLAVSPIFTDTGVATLLRRPLTNVAAEYMAYNADRFRVEGGQAMLFILTDTLVFAVLRRLSDPAPFIDDDLFYELLLNLVLSPLRPRA